MKLLGLTGGIGMGKSAAADLLRQRGVPVVDTDLLARQAVEPGSPAIQEILRAFGSAMVRADGTLDRRRLAEVVFADTQARAQLEAILHPRIRSAWLDQARQWRQEGLPVGVVVIPLLYETGAQSSLDAVVCVACSAATQWERLQPRGWSPGQIQQRLGAQWTIDRKIALANFVVWTEGSLDVHARQWDKVLARVRSS